MDRRKLQRCREVAVSTFRKVVKACSFREKYQQLPLEKKHEVRLRGITYLFVVLSCILYWKFRPAKFTPWNKVFFTGIPITLSSEAEDTQLDYLPKTISTVEDMRLFNLGAHLHRKASDIDLMEEKQHNGNNSIPNIVHYVILQSVHSRLSKPTFTLLQYLSIRSAYLRLRPKAIIVHYDIEPQGSYWELIKPIIIPIKVHELPTSIYDRKIVQVEHMSDIVRLRALKEYGGVYFDTDVVAVRSFDDLRNSSDFILGRETRTDGTQNFICNAVLIGQKHSAFLHRWYDSYKSFNYWDWNEHSAKVPFALHEKYPKESTLLPNKYFFKPMYDYDGSKELYERDDFDFSDNYAVHMFRSMKNSILKRLNMYDVVFTKVALHRILRPILPNPFVTIAIEISPKSRNNVVSDLLVSLDSIRLQKFPLYEVALIDNSKGSLSGDWSKAIMQQASLHPELGVRIVHGKEGGSPPEQEQVYRPNEEKRFKKLIQDRREPGYAGAWRLELAPGEVIDPYLLAKFVEELEENTDKYFLSVGSHTFHFVYTK